MFYSASLTQSAEEYYHEIVLNVIGREPINNYNHFKYKMDSDHVEVIEAYGKQVSPGTFPTLKRNGAIARDLERKLPKPMVIAVKINGQTCIALVDSGSQSDFMSTSVADQLKVDKIELAVPLVVQLAVQGSRSKVNHSTTVDFQYQGIKCPKYFDIMNIQGYDLILGTPFIFQHQIQYSLNPPVLVVHSNVPKKVEGERVARLQSLAAGKLEDMLERARSELMTYALPICAKAGDTGLPPFRAVNHEIPLVDETKIYPWRPSKCPEALRPQWSEKKEVYLKSGRWRHSTATNVAPMLLIYKMDKVRLRTVIDLRERNKNTVKLASPCQIWTPYCVGWQLISTDHRLMVRMHTNRFV
jgi:hypothetical protein